jgi:hypothetical protein
MELPHVKELNINGMGRYLLLNLGVGERGAKFITQNVKNLTTLHIGKQWSNSDNNSVEELGAIAIANGLKNLSNLHIGKQ